MKAQNLQISNIPVATAGEHRKQNLSQVVAHHYYTLPHWSPDTRNKRPLDKMPGYIYPNMAPVAVVTEFSLRTKVLICK